MIRITARKVSSKELLVCIPAIIHQRKSCSNERRSSCQNEKNPPASSGRVLKFELQTVLKRNVVVHVVKTAGGFGRCCGCRALGRGCGRRARIALALAAV
jgi:hypothetical protein